MEKTQPTAKGKFDLNSLKPFDVCLVVTVIAVIGSMLALVLHSAFLALFFLLPAVIYEVIRTEEGASTKISSIMLLGIIVLELILILFGVNYDLANFFGESEKYIAGYTLPLGDIKVFGPLLTAVLSVILVFRTYGTYTKWLSIVIAGGSLVAVLLISPTFFQEALKLIVNSLLDRFYYAY